MNNATASQGVDVESLRKLWDSCEQLQRQLHDDRNGVTPEAVLKEKKSWFKKAYAFFSDGERQRDDHWWEKYGEILEPMFEFMATLGSYAKIDALYQRMTAQISGCLSCCDEYYRRKSNCLEKKGYAPAIRMVCRNLLTRDQERVSQLLEKIANGFEEGLIEESEIKKLRFVLWEVLSREDYAADEKISELICTVLKHSSDAANSFVTLASERMKSMSSLFSFACCSGASGPHVFLNLAAKIHAISDIRIDEKALSQTFKKFSELYSGGNWKLSSPGWQGLKGALGMIADESGDVARLTLTHPQLWSSMLVCFDDDREVHPEVIEILKLILESGRQQAWTEVAEKFTELGRKILARFAKRMDSVAAVKNLSLLLQLICELTPAIAPLHIEITAQLEDVQRHQTNPNADLLSISLKSAIKSVEYAEDAHMNYIGRIIARADRRRLDLQRDSEFFCLCCRGFSLASMAYLRNISENEHSSDLTVNSAWSTQLKCLQAMGLRERPSGSYKVSLNSITKAGRGILEAAEYHSCTHSVATFFEEAIVVICVFLPLLRLVDTAEEEWRRFSAMAVELAEKATTFADRNTANTLIAKTAATALLFSGFDSKTAECRLKTWMVPQRSFETGSLPSQLPAPPLTEAFLCFARYITGFTSHKDTGTSLLGPDEQKGIALIIWQGIQNFQLYSITNTSETDFFADIKGVVHAICSRDLEPLLALAFLDLVVRIPEKILRRQLGLVRKVYNKCRDMNSEIYTNATSRVDRVLNLNSFGWKPQTEDKPKMLQHITPRETSFPPRAQEKLRAVKVVSNAANKFRMPDYRGLLMDIIVVAESSGNLKSNLRSLKRPLAIQEKIPSVFDNSQQYISMFWPLLYEELLASLESSLRSFQTSAKANQEEIKIESTERKDDTLKIFFTVRENQDDELEKDFAKVSESDVLVLSAQSARGNDIILPFLLLVDKKVRKESVVTPGKKPVAIFESRVSMKHKQYIKPGCRYTTWRLCSFLPNDREFKSLKDVDAITGISQIFQPKKASSFDYTSNTHKIPPALFQRLSQVLNLSQIRAVQSIAPLLRQPHSINFVLIQGPPGTGKTSTILALTSAIMSMRGKARGFDDEVDTSKLETSTSTNSTKAPSGRMRILVSAQSNAAVDEILRRLVTQGKGFVDTSGRDSICNAVRIGNIANCVGEKAREYHVDTLQSKQESGTTLKLQVKYSIIKDADVVCSTLNSTNLLNFASLYNKRIEEFPNFTFDAVIIDEAAQVIGDFALRQAIEPAALSSLSFLRKGGVCIMVGDPKQLPATILSKRASLLEQSMFLRFQRAGVLCHILDTQYRMHPSISRFPSLHFYEGKLRDDPKMASKTQCSFHKCLEFGPFIFYDIVNGKQSGRTSVSASLENYEEAWFAIKLLKKLQSAYEREISQMSIGIITPYRNQVTLLRRKIKENFGSKYNITVATIDSFQGRELDVVLFSAVRTSIGDGTAIGFLSDVRRINVALTRAKSCMWIIGNCSALQGNADWKALIEFATLRKSLRKVQDVSTWELSSLDRPPPSKQVAKRPLNERVPKKIEVVRKRQMNENSGDDKRRKHQPRSDTAQVAVSNSRQIGVKTRPPQPPTAHSSTHGQKRLKRSPEKSKGRMKQIEDVRQIVKDRLAFFNKGR